MRTWLIASVFCSTSWTTNPALQGYLAVHSHGTGVFYLQPHFSIFLDICYILYKTLSTLREEAIFFACVCLCARWLQWGPTLCKPMDCSLSGSSVHGILQARILEWVAIAFSRGSSQPRDRTQVSRIGGRRFNLWATREALRVIKKRHLPANKNW